MSIFIFFNFKIYVNVILIFVNNREKNLKKNFTSLSINQIDECHISQDQTQKINFLRDPLLEDRFIHLFNKIHIIILK